MSHVVSGKLRKEPFVKPGVGQDGSATMFVIELSEVNKDYRSGEKSYTNYKAMFFAKSQAALDYYSKAFAEGGYVTVACEKLKIDSREHNGQVYTTLSMENARLSGALPVSDQVGQPAQQYNQQPARQQYQQPAQQSSYPDDIPF